MYETFFYWFGVGSFVCLMAVLVPLLLAVPALGLAWIGRGFLETVLKWDEYWLEYEEDENEGETMKNKIEAYEEAHENDRWEAKVSRMLSNSHQWCSDVSDWYIEMIDTYVWKKLPLVGR